MKRLPGFIVALAFAASANSAAFAEPDNGPQAVGVPHSCSNYPEIEQINGVEGETLVSFRVGIDGVPKDLSVATSSASDDLDQAALQCVSGWRYAPATQGGSPIEVPWKAKVVWHIETVDPATAGATHICPLYNGWRPIMQNATISMQFRVTKDGHVADGLVLQTSGDPDLDAFALKCVSAWTYQPLQRNGLPVEFVWGAKIALSGHDSSVTEGFGRPHSCSAVMDGKTAVSGDVTLSFTITEQGNTKDISVRESSGNELLDRSAVACASFWHYLPARNKGQAIAVPWKAVVRYRTVRSTAAELGVPATDGPKP